MCRPMEYPPYDVKVRAQRIMAKMRAVVIAEQIRKQRQTVPA